MTAISSTIDGFEMDLYLSPRLVSLKPSIVSFLARVILPSLPRGLVHTVRTIDGIRADIVTFRLERQIVLAMELPVKIETQLKKQLDLNELMDTPQWRKDLVVARLYLLAGQLDEAMTSTLLRRISGEPKRRGY